MPRKKLPTLLALLDEDLCTGCEACVAVCPADCIRILPGSGVGQICRIELPQCIGCTLCAQVCPWDCINMVPTEQLLKHPRTARLVE